MLTIVGSTPVLFLHDSKYIDSLLPILDLNNDRAHRAYRQRFSGYLSLPTFKLITKLI